MRRVLKFVVNPGTTLVTTNDRPRWLAVGAQGSQVVAWCEATPDDGNGQCGTLLGAVMTGEGPPPDGQYIGTAQQSDGIVVHVYAKGPDR